MRAAKNGYLDFLLNSGILSSTLAFDVTHLAGYIEMKIAYLMSRFPKITETFILYEILALQANNIKVEIYPLLREKEKVMHGDAEKLMPEVNFLPLLSTSVLLTNLTCLMRTPGRYLSTWYSILKGSWGCSNFFWGAIIFFPKAVLLAKHMQRAGITHIHAHFANHPTLVALVIHKLTQIPYSFTGHGSDIHKHQQMLAVKYHSAKFAVMVSRYNKDFVLKNTNITSAERMQVIRCGIDPAQFSVKQDYKLHKSINILCVASLREVKGHRYLIAACAVLQAKAMPFTLHLVGTGPKANAIRRQVKSLGLQAQVHLHGDLTRVEVLAKLQAADIFVLSSYQTKQGNREGIPVGLMEAMATGLPVVASRVSGIPELVEHGHNGLLSKVQDPQDIADKLTLLMTDEAARKQLGESGRRKVCEQYDLNKNVAKLMRLF